MLITVSIQQRGVLPPGLLLWPRGQKAAVDASRCAPSFRSLVRKLKATFKSLGHQASSCSPFLTTLLGQTTPSTGSLREMPGPGQEPQVLFFQASPQPHPFF